MYASKDQQLNMLWIGSQIPESLLRKHLDHTDVPDKLKHDCSNVIQMDIRKRNTLAYTVKVIEKPDAGSLLSMRDTIDCLVVCNLAPEIWDSLSGQLPILYMGDNSSEQESIEQYPDTTFILTEHANQNFDIEFDTWLTQIQMQIKLQRAEHELHETQLERDDARLGLAMLGEQLVELSEHDEEASHIQERILALVSHELRTPLNGIVGMSELLGSTDLDEIQNEEIRLIRESAIKLSKLVDSLLDYRQLKFSESHVHESDFDLYQCIEQVIEHMQPQAIGSGLLLYDLIESTTPQMVHGDVEKIRKILYCLISNALKFTPKGSVVIKVRCLPVMGDVDYLQITVQDTGIGIPSEKIETIFDAFTQLEDYHTRAHEGLGIGLYMARNLMTMLDGEILVKSQPGSGSEFTLRMPMKKVSSVISQNHLIWQQVHNARVLIWTEDRALADLLILQLDMAHCLPTILHDANALEAALSDRQSASCRGADVLLVDERFTERVTQHWFERLMHHRMIPAACIQSHSQCMLEESIPASHSINWDFRGIYLNQQIQLMQMIAQLFRAPQNTPTDHIPHQPLVATPGVHLS